jgi:hypothetical protein
LTVQGQFDTVQLDLEFVFLSECDDCSGNFLIERAIFLMETNVEERFDVEVVDRSMVNMSRMTGLDISIAQ